MKKPVLYLAHPVSGDLRGNAERAIEWLVWFHRHQEHVIVVAPWVAEVLGFADEDVGEAPRGTVAPGTWDRVLPDDEEVVRHCDGLVMVGGRVSGGMARERNAALTAGLCVTDMTTFVHPWDVPLDFHFDVEAL